MVEIKSKNLKLKELKKNSDFSGLIKSSDFFKDITNFEKGSIYFEILKNNKLEGLIGLEVIGAMNEFKLAKLHFSCSDAAILDEALAILLDYAINDYFVLKIISHLDNQNEKAADLLKQKGFILNQELTDNVHEYKITKPMYLRK